MPKRGAASRNYAQSRRSAAAAWNEFVAAAAARVTAAELERKKLHNAVSVIDTFVGHCFDEESLAEWRPRAAEALGYLRELVDNTEFVE